MCRGELSAKKSVNIVITTVSKKNKNKHWLGFSRRCAL